MEWVPERYQGFCWDHRCECDMEINEQNLITILDPKDPLSYIPSQQKVQENI